MDREGGGSSIGNTKEAEQMSPIGGLDRWKVTQVTGTGGVPASEATAGTVEFKTDSISRHIKASEALHLIQCTILKIC